MLVAAIIGSLVFLFVTVIYVLLAIGLPLGEYAMGGKHRIMPKGMRVACVISAAVQMFAAFCILQAAGILEIGAWNDLARGACYFFAFYLALNTVMNALSRSKKEKMIMTPLSFVASVCFFFVALNA
ncbi:hypothetical protein M6D81_03760 [Paenibacillus sp. J5C_2022]|uniref:hypothetical protein n=1 Tax=Paenibacillus sp. J5C2022 TaxID=2977129 RepID=UPI0021D073A7|nr:hypothetical protein [Paenibacillus sp. J5C2022]MCU6707818.1 hypothetical protein [Paenibacillus sp. J5C2022]